MERLDLIQRYEFFLLPGKEKKPSGLLAEYKMYAGGLRK